MAGKGLQFLPLSRLPAKWDPVWFAQFCREVLALADTRNAIEGSGITITGQPGETATVSASADITNLLSQSFVLTSPSGFLNFERTLAGESGVVTIADGGANASITINLTPFGTPLNKLALLPNYGVLGNRFNGSSQVERIEPVVTKSVLALTGTTITFDLIDNTYVSDFAEAAQDAVGAMLVDTATIHFVYTDATPSLTANVIADSVDNTLLANMAQATIKGRAAGAGTGDPTDLTAAQVATILSLDSGHYTPTLTNVLNLAASTAFQCQWLRVGNTVHVSGRVDVDPTAAGSTQLGITLPVASNLGAAEDCAGCAFASGIAGQGAAILADATNDRAQMQWVAVDLTNQPMYFTFTYEVLP